jgi:hypothetical protein
LPADDAFLKSIQRFTRCVQRKDEREESYDEILRQSEILGQAMSCLAVTGKRDR